jgi:uncharacterized protein (DUF58 family)
MGIFESTNLTKIQGNKMSHKIEQQFLQQYGQLELIAKQVVEGFITGLHKSPFHGFSVEFAEHRLYNTGESTKHIDWKLFARTEKLFVKRYEEETNLRCQVILDSSSSMYFPEIDLSDNNQFNKIKFAVYATAALAELFRRQRDAVGLSVFDANVNVHTAAKSSQRHQKLMHSELEKLLVNRPVNAQITNAAKCIHEIAHQLPKRSLVIIFSDMMEPQSGEENEALFSALKHLKHNKHEVILFHTTDQQKEINFEMENRPYHFIDVETGEELKVHPKDVKATYLKKITAFNKALKLKCGQFGIDFVESPINEGFNQVLLPYLIKRSKMA